MKKLLLSALLVGLTVGAYAQGAGTVLLNNNQNSGASPSATSSGLVFLSGSPTTVDLNVALFGFTDSSSVLSHPVASLIGAAAAGDSLGGAFPGTFTDLSATAYAVDGTTTASTSAFFILQAWIGNDLTYAAAVAAGHAAGQTTVFANALGGVGSPPSTPPGLDSMPGLTLVTTTPEPSTFALAGLGAAALLIFRRRK